MSFKKGSIVTRQLLQEWETEIGSSYMPKRSGKGSPYKLTLISFSRSWKARALLLWLRLRMGSSPSKAALMFWAAFVFMSFTFVPLDAGSLEDSLSVSCSRHKMLPFNAIETHALQSWSPCTVLSISIPGLKARLFIRTDVSLGITCLVKHQAYAKLHKLW